MLRRHAMTATETPVERPVEFVQSLPEARRRDIFFALLREFYAANGDLAAIPLREGDTDLGYLVRPDGVLTGYQKLMMSLPREVAEHLSVAIPDDLDDCLSEEEVEAIHRRVEARHAQ